MSKMRVYEVANQLGLDHVQVAKRCRDLGFDVENHLAQLDSDQVSELTRALSETPVNENLQEKRIRKTVIRRRRKAEPEPAPAEVAAATAAPEPTGATTSAEPLPDTGVEAPEQQEAVDPVALVAAQGAPEVAAAPAEAGATDETETPAADAAATARTPANPYATAEPVNNPAAKARATAEERQSYVQVLGTIDPALAQNLHRTGPTRPARSTGPGPGPGPRTGHPSNRPVGADPMSIPLPDRGRRAAPGAPETDRNKRKRKGGRVAYDRAKDRTFDGQMRTRGRRSTKRKKLGQSTEITVPKASKRIVKLQDTITVGELAQQLAVKSNEIIKYLMGMGEMVTVNHVIDLDTVTLIAQEYDFTVENVAFDLDNFIPKVAEDEEAIEPRNAVVTVMGHVDHGKTTLLDNIRGTRVAAGEAGGITQHIGAYKVSVTVGEEQKTLVFLDTPGHEAFTEMRARGANVTDIVILVVAADDGVMPQTIEAINHAKAAEVPIVVAVNKIDREDADPDRVRAELGEHGIVPEDWGGDTQVLHVSAINGDGIPELLEAVSLQAELLELTANPDRPAIGVVVEAELSRGRGPVATVLVQQGTLRRGDIVVAGKSLGRVRALVDDKGDTIDAAGPSTPVEVLGLNQVPEPSDKLFVVRDEKDGRQVVSHLDQKGREKRLAQDRKRVSLDDLFERMEAGDVKTLALIIKSDVQGSLEALRSAFEKLKHPDLEVRIVHAGVGPVNESDVTLAAASQAIIVGFNIRPEKKAKALADQEGVEVKLYSVIYDAVDEMKAAMEGLLDKLVEEQSLGRADVREIFRVSKAGNIAGCAVLQGKIVRHAHARLVRDGTVVYTGRIDTLRRCKDNVNEVDRGHECGIKLTNFSDVKQGDEIECYELIEVTQTLDI